MAARLLVPAQKDLPAEQLIRQRHANTSPKNAVIHGKAAAAVVVAYASVQTTGRQPLP
jgi:hypothetical protein